MQGPTEKELVQARLSFVRRDLDEILQHLGQEMMGWAPGEGVRTIASQLVEIGSNEFMTMACMCEGKHLSWEEAEAPFGDGESFEKIKEMLASVRQDTLKALDSYTEEQLKEPVTVKLAWYASIGLPQVPRSEIFKSIAQHESYHVAQLVTYLWIRGDDPYAW